MSKRYTCGDRVKAYHPTDRTMYYLLDNGVPTVAMVSYITINHIHDACEITAGVFRGGCFFGGTFTGGMFYSGMFFGGEFTNATMEYTTLCGYYLSESGYMFE